MLKQNTTSNIAKKAALGVVTSTVDACADPEVLTDDAAGTVPVRREAPGLPLECATGASVNEDTPHFHNSMSQESDIIHNSAE